MTVLDDRDVISNVHSLEATDEAGRAVVERARAAMGAPAETTMFTDFHATDRAWLIRATDETLRRRGHIQELVVHMLARREEPTLDDLAAALTEAPDAPIPMVVRRYAANVLRGQPRRTGPKTPTRTTATDLTICAHYQSEVEKARHNYAADNRKPRAFANVAKQATAKAFGISQRTVERIIALRHSPRVTSE
jgi:hypothetical protein